MNIKKDQVWTDKEMGGEVLVLRVDNRYVHYQDNGTIKPIFHHEFLEKFERGEGSE